MNRRKFFASSAAVAIATAAATATGLAGPLAAGAAPAMSPALPPSGARPYKFVHDERYPDARAFGVAAAQAYSSARTAAIRGDVTLLWSQDLRARWSAGGGVIAGMTTARALFCLEQLAKDHWMRVVIRAEHAMSGRQVLSHAVTAPEAMIASIRSVLDEADWPARMPAVLARCPAWDGTARRTEVLASAGGRGRASAEASLVSFVIA